MYLKRVSQGYSLIESGPGPKIYATIEYSTERAIYLDCVYM